jgi:hypothetical protein
MPEAEFPNPIPTGRPLAATSAGVWSIVGLLVGAITGQCVWDTLCYGDFGAGAWAGGMLQFLLAMGTVGGVANATTSLGERAGCGATAAAWTTGAILGGSGLPGIFLFVLCTVRRCFEGAGESLKSAESNAQMVLLAALLGWTAGLILGATQGCVNRWLGGPLAKDSRPPS